MSGDAGAMEEARRPVCCLRSVAGDMGLTRGLMAGELFGKARTGPAVLGTTCDRPFVTRSTVVFRLIPGRCELRAGLLASIRGFDPDGCEYGDCGICCCCCCA